MFLGSSLTIHSLNEFEISAILSSSTNIKNSVLTRPRPQGFSATVPCSVVTLRMHNCCHFIGYYRKRLPNKVNGS